MNSDQLRANMQTSMTSPWREPMGHAALLALAAIAIGVLLVVPPIAQKLAYHQFHDARSWLGIPNALNVLSNIPFAVIGVLGLLELRSASPHRVLPLLRPAYAVLFAGVALTGFGSAYYHWSPDNRTLIWDRLPMALAFMGLFAAMLGERVSLQLGRRLLWPLTALGVFSVVWWATVDDLRLYGIVQFYPLLAIPLLLWLFPARYSHAGFIMTALACYGIAKALEDADGLVFRHAELVSGHTLKHLAAALGAWCIVLMLKRRRPLADADLARA